MGNRDREVSQRDLVRSRSHIDEWPEVSRQREDVEWPVGCDEMPLIARAEQGGGWYRARALALGAEDPSTKHPTPIAYYLNSVYFPDLNTGYA